MAKERSSNFELLRIVSMIMIVFYHYAFLSNFNFVFLETTPINYAFLNFLELFGKVGVDIFVLISGYFLIKKDSVKISKLVKLWLQILFFSVLSYALFSFNIIESENFENSVILFLERIMPLSHENWWFASTYFLLYLFSPFLNKFLKSMSHRQYFVFLLLAFLVGSVVAALTNNEIEGMRLFPLLFVYSIGGYIGLYLDEKRFNQKKLWLILIITIVLNILIVLIFHSKAKSDTVIQGYFWFMVGSETFPLTLVIAVCLFLIFKGLKIGNKKIINVIASASFGVYLIHDDSFLKIFIWRTICRGSDFQYGKLLIPYTIAVCLGVYAACTIVELARIYLLEKNYMKLVYKAEPKINRVLHKLVDSVYEKIR